MAGLTPISFTTSQFMPESEDIARRQKLADALQMQSMEPGPSGNMVSGWYVSPSWTQSLAHALKGVQASAIRDQAQKDRMDLSQRQASERQDALARAMLAARGTPASSETIMDETANGGEGQMAQINAPAVKADPMRAMSILAGSQDPMLAQAGTSALVKGMGPQNPWASNIAHLDPGKYTPESIQAAISANDPWQLRPRVTPNAELTARLGYDKLAQAAYQFHNLSAADQEKYKALAAKEGRDVLELFYNTGLRGNAYQPGRAVNAPQPTPPGIGTPLPASSGLPGAPQGALQPAPQPSPQPAPQPASQAAPAPVYDDRAPTSQAAMEAIQANMLKGGRGGTIYYDQPSSPEFMAPNPNAPRPLPPKDTDAIEKERRKNQNEREDKRSFTMGGITETLKTAEDILTGKGVTGIKPTQSGVGTVADTIGAFFGSAPKGSAEADALKTYAARLINMMPRMEGPQSDADRQFYKESAGQVGDSTLPIARRLAALKAVRDLYSKYDKQSGAAPANQGTGKIKFLGFEQ